MLGYLSRTNIHILHIQLDKKDEKENQEIYCRMSIEPVFVNLVPGIDSQPGGPVRQPYLANRPARLQRLAESIPGLLKCWQIWAQLKIWRLDVKRIIRMRIRWRMELNWKQSTRTKHISKIGEYCSGNREDWDNWGRKKGRRKRNSQKRGGMIIRLIIVLEF